MDQRQLTAFVTLAEELHFLRAAGRLRVTQPALSQQIARLEQRLGVSLFQRTRRRVALTDAGQSFLDEATLILRQMELAEEMARRAAAGQIGRLTIGFADAAALNVLPVLASAYTRGHPGVKLILHEMISHEQVEALRAGRIQVGLLRPVFDDENLEKLLLRREPYVVAVAAGHPLAAETTVRLQALRDQPLITTSRVKARYIEGKFRGPFQRAGIKPNVVQEVNELHAILGLVAGGLGIALFPASVTKLTLQGVVYRPLAIEDSPVAELVLAWRKGDDTPTVRDFVKMARHFSGLVESDVAE